MKAYLSVHDFVPMPSCGMGQHKKRRKKCTHLFFASIGTLWNKYKLSLHCYLLYTFWSDRKHGLSDHILQTKGLPVHTDVHIRTYSCPCLCMHLRKNVFLYNVKFGGRTFLLNGTLEPLVILKNQIQAGWNLLVVCLTLWALAPRNFVSLARIELVSASRSKKGS
jgi:hypothetical protein